MVRSKLEIAINHTKIQTKREIKKKLQKKLKSYHINEDCFHFIKYIELKGCKN